MQLSPRKQKAYDDSGLIPMINVVFLLLVFFMIAGTIKSAEPLDVQSPDSTQDKPWEGQQPVVFVSANGSLAFDSHSHVLSPEELVQRLNEWQTGPEKPAGGSSSGGDHTMARLGLKADLSVTIVQLRDVMSLLREAGITEVELLTNQAQGGGSAIPTL